MIKTNKVENHLEKINFLIISIFSLLLVSGPFFSELGLIVLIFSYLFLSRWQFFKIQLLKKFLIIYLFFFLIILSSIFSDNIIYSLKSSFFYPRFILFSLAISFFLSKSEKVLVSSFYTLLSIFLFLFFDSILQYLISENLTGLSISGNRASSLFGDELILGSYILRLYPLLLSLFFFIYYDKLSVNFFIKILILSIIVDFTVLLSGERTAFFLLILQKLMMLIFIQKLRKIIFLNFCILLVGVGVLLNNNSSVKERLYNDTKKYINIDFKNKVFRPFTSEHSEIFETSYEMYLKNKILGVGPKNFRNLCDNDDYKKERRFSCSTHPHNFYIQLLAEGGIFVFLTFLIIYIVSFRFYSIKLNSEKKQKYKYSFLLCLITFSTNFWPLAPSASFFNNWINMIIYLPLGFLIYNYNIIRQNEIIKQ